MNTYGFRNGIGKEYKEYGTYKKCLYREPFAFTDERGYRGFPSYFMLL